MGKIRLARRIDSIENPGAKTSGAISRKLGAANILVKCSQLELIRNCRCTRNRATVESPMAEAECMFYMQDQVQGSTP